VTGGSEAVAPASTGTIGSDFLIGGDGSDALTGGSGVNFLDFSMFGLGFIFDVNNSLVGDVASNGDSNTTFIGGKDTLISGMLAADTMTGDSSSGLAGSFAGGSDTFVFGSENGTDTITDFERGTDVINLFDTGLDFLDLDSDGSGTLDALDANVSISGGNTVIGLGGAAGGATGPNTVTINAVTGMDTTDFDFSMLIA
jgi:hypothetical protein